MNRITEVLCTRFIVGAFREYIDIGIDASKRRVAAVSCTFVTVIALGERMFT